MPKLSARRRTRRNEPYLRLPWSPDEEESYAKLQVVEQAFFGTNRPWDPIVFKKPIIELSIDGIRNRIALLGESIGWTPDIDDKAGAAREIVKFREETTAICFFCYEDKPLWQIAVLNCEHVSCMDCVKRNIRMCLQDTSLLPARCCSPYPYIYTSIAAENLKDLEKLARFIVDEVNPAPIVSCHQCKRDLFAGCVAGDIAYCIRCRERTCVKCNVRWHNFPRVQCRIDSDMSRLVDLAISEKWSQCYRCGMAVEKADGCMHMICRCGVDFCYRCGGPWPVCPCSVQTRSEFYRSKFTFKRIREDAVNAGELYTANLQNLHERHAEENERRFNETLDALKLLRMLKTYQMGVAREIDGLRKILRQKM
ncbi:hypothetical protein ABW21_db0209139 [Orbilia brochopaga]|nr:hypothetical protein ABW21_db0209139 [Drechslerella brochopaga]